MAEGQKLSIKQAITGILKLQDQGRYSTLIGIGPMSSNLLKASFELARDEDFPLMFIASRNQVDKDELGGGYVNGWNQQTLLLSNRLLLILTLLVYIIYVEITEDHGNGMKNVMHIYRLKRRCT